MEISPSSIGQVLIFATGIYLALSFLRTTRGSGLVRGLVVSGLVVAVGLYGLAVRFELEELSYILSTSGGYVVILLAILFQPELRRGIVQLGENPWVGRWIRSGRKEAVGEVAQAVIKMAAKRQGALIAFERQTPLDAFIESGVKVDSAVGRLLIDSLFHHGAALHDGAVIIRGERVAAAGCLFPLTESRTISKSTGTRHRAALGLTEESDALVVVVSEETGGISICESGKMREHVAPSELELELRTRLGAGDSGSRSPRARVRSLFLDDLPRKAGAVLLAIALFVAARQNINRENNQVLTINVAQVAPRGGARSKVLHVVLPAEDYVLASPVSGERLLVEVSGKSSKFEELGGEFGGVFTVPPGTPPGTLTVPTSDVTWWGAGRLAKGLEFKWPPQAEPRLVLERVSRYTVRLAPEHVAIDTERLNKRYRCDAARARISPATIEVLGPLASVQALDTGQLPFRLSTITLDESDDESRTEVVALSPALVDQHLSLAEGTTIEVVLPIVPTEYPLGTIEREISLVALSGSADHVGRFRPITAKASFSVLTRGIIPADLDPTSAAFIERSSEILLYLEDNLRAFVDVTDVDDAAPADQLRVPILYHLKTYWRKVLPDEMGAKDLRALLDVELISDSHVYLRPK